MRYSRTLRTRARKDWRRYCRCGRAPLQIKKLIEEARKKEIWISRIFKKEKPDESYGGSFTIFRFPKQKIAMLPQAPSQLILDEQHISTAYKFLDFIFDPFDRGFIEFKYFEAGAAQKPGDPSDFVPLPLPLEHEKITEFLKQQVFFKNGQQSIAVGPAPRTRLPKKGKNSQEGDIEEIGCIWADLDYDKTPGGTIEVIKRISNLELRPTIVVNSGYGRHVYYCFNEPLRDLQLLEWKGMIRTLRYKLDSDDVSETSQVMRLPGSLNLKHEQPVQCRISEEESSWVRYSPLEVQRAFAPSSMVFLNTGLEDPESNKAVVNYFKEVDKIDAFYPRNPVDEPSGLYVESPSIEEIKRRGVSAKVIECIVTGTYTTKIGHNAEKSIDPQERDLLIATALLEKDFTEAEVNAVYIEHAPKWDIEYSLELGAGKYGVVYFAGVVETAKAKINEKFVKKGIYEILDEFGEDSMPPGYELKEDGSIWLVIPSNKATGEPKYTLVADSPIRITEIRENIDNGQISVALSYKYSESWRKSIISRSQMCDGRSLVATLSSKGAPVASDNARLVVSYLRAYEHAFSKFIPHKKVTSKLGRGTGVGRFFLPGVTKDVEFEPQSAGDAEIYRAFAARRGRFGEWLEVINTLESENLLIPQIAIICTFVPPLQRILQIPNFILDIFGGTSSGKSTTLKLAASVYGKPHDPESLIMQWMNTKVAVEQLAGTCSGLPIFLDDAQHCQDNLKRDIIYMIANGKGKARGSGGGGIKETASWHTVALSTSEEPLHESSPHEGARGRILPVGGIYRPFPRDSANLVQSMERAVGESYGHAGERFIRHLNDWNDNTWMRWQSRYISARKELLRESSSDIVGRISGYIAAIGVAAEIAAPLLGLRFKPDVICAWLLTHLQEQQSNQNQVLMALRVLADHFASNKNQFAGTENFNATRTSLQGLIKQGQYVCFLRKTIDKAFAPKKWNSWTILNKMGEAEVIHSAEKDRHTRKIRVEGIPHRMVCVKWSALFPND